MLADRMLAWVEPLGKEGGYLAAYIAEDTAEQRAPATQRFDSAEDGRRWVEKETTTLGLPVEWVNPPDK